VKDGQTDMTKLIVTCRNFANAPNISAICLHIVLMRSIRHAQYEVIFSLYNGLVPLMETVGVYCEVRLHLHVLFRCTSVLKVLIKGGSCAENLFVETCS